MKTTVVNVIYVPDGSMPNVKVWQEIRVVPNFKEVWGPGMAL